MLVSNEVTIYGLFDPRDGLIRYVGKANNPYKRLKAHLRELRRRTPLYDWIGFLRKEGITPHIRILEIVSASTWQEAEKRQIAFYRATSTRLLNVADGGDEPKCPYEIRVKNGSRIAGTRDHRLWKIKWAVGQILAHSKRLTDEEKSRVRIAVTTYPERFARFAGF